jgi:DNA-binding PucR family transcriptional regulator
MGHAPSRGSAATRPSPGSAAVEVALRASVAAIVADADAIARSVAELLHREVPEASVDPLSLEETRRTCRATLLALVDGWRRGEPLERVPPPPELLFQIGIMVRDGIPLGPLVRICHLAHGAFADAWDERIAGAELTSELQARTMRLAHQQTFAWFDGLVTQLTAAYEEERERAARTPETQRREAVQAALSGKTVDVDALSRTAAYEFRRHHVGLVLWRGTPISDGVPAALDAQPAFAAVAREIAAALRAAPPLVVASASSVAWGWIAVREPVAVAQVRAAVAGARPDGVSVAFADPSPGLQGFRDTHQDALAASRVAMLQGGGAAAAGAAIAFEDVELAALLSDDLDRARRFVLRQLAQLAEDDPQRARLRATLRIYLEEHGSRTATARRLGIHPNTVTNRAKLCEALVGRSLLERPVELQVALALAETLGVRGGRSAAG